MPIFEAGVLRGAIWQPVEAEETKAESWKTFDDEEPFPIRYSGLDMPDTVRNEASERPCDCSRTKEPKYSKAELVSVVPKAEIVDNAGAEKTFKYSKEDSTHE